MIGHVMREFLPWRHLLTYLEAILRVYNRYGRRDNLNKARIKILVKERGPDKFREEIEAEWAHLKDGPSTLVPRRSSACRRGSRGRCTRNSKNRGQTPTEINRGLTPFFRQTPFFRHGRSATSIRT